MKLLFICSQNHLRSPTAEALFDGLDEFEARSAGTDRDAVKTVDEIDIEWADVIFAMEQRHRKALQKLFPDLLKGKRLYVLGIPDKYDRDDPELIAELDDRVYMLLEKDGS